MRTAAKRRGQPLVVLGGVLALWCAMRIALWESPFPLLPEPIGEFFAEGSASEPPVRSAGSGAAVGLTVRSAHSASRDGGAPNGQGAALPLALATGGMPSPGGGFDTMASHQYLWLAALEQRRGLAAGGSARFGAPGLGRPLSAGAPPPPAADRWSLEGWVYLRQGATSSSAPGLLSPVYGASQAGAVLRHRLAPRSNLRPEAYARFTSALAGPEDRELAVGLAARPLNGVPVAAQAELRARMANGRTEFRPAAMLVSEVAPLDLPAGLRAEVYAQGGYVGGRFATPFADGQARMTREVAAFDLGELRAGAGAWGGAQRGAARLDIGPSASVDMRLGDSPARLALDYRLRVAGDAEPGSGVAVTLSSGF